MTAAAIFCLAYLASPLGLISWIGPVWLAKFPGG
jgi:hypothetical protein